MLAFNRGSNWLVILWLSAPVAVLGQTPDSSAPTIASLRKTLSEGTDQEKLAAIKSLGIAGAGAKEAIPDLLSLSEAGVFYEASMAALKSIGPLSIPASMELFKNGNEKQRWIGYVASYNVSRGDVAAENRLIVLGLSDKMEKIQRRALRELLYLQPPSLEHLPRVTQLVTDPKTPIEVRKDAIDAVAIFQKDAISILPTLRTIVRDKNDVRGLRFQAMGSMSTIGKDDQESADLLDAITRDQKEQFGLRLGALRCLRTSSKRQPAMEQIEEFLEYALKSKNPSSIAWIPSLLEEMEAGKPTKKSIPLLRDVLIQETMIGLEDAAVLKVVAKLGPEAMEFVPFLTTRIRALKGDLLVVDYVDALEKVLPPENFKNLVDDLISGRDVGIVTADRLAQKYRKK